MIPVYILSNDTKKCFDSTKFDIRDFSYESKDSNIEHMHEESFREYDTILEILKDFKLKCKSPECIIVKSDVYTLIPPDEFAAYITSITSRDDYDIFYLSYYLDACNLHHNVDILHDSIHINKIEEPYGFHAVIIKASLVDILLKIKPMKNGKYIDITSDIPDINMLLSTHIKEGNIVAKNTYPPLMYYDIRKANRSEDYLKVDPCRSIITIKTNYYIKWIVLLILFIVLIFIVVILFIIQKRRK